MLIPGVYIKGNDLAGILNGKIKALLETSMINRSALLVLYHDKVKLASPGHLPGNSSKAPSPPRTPGERAAWGESPYLPAAWDVPSQPLPGTPVVLILIVTSSSGEFAELLVLIRVNLLIFNDLRCNRDYALAQFRLILHYVQNPLWTRGGRS